MRSLWLSVHPRWIDAILSGHKSVELRRRPPGVSSGTEALLYSTSPVCQLVARATVETVVERPLEELWRSHGSCAAVSRREFDEYFSGRETGTAIELGEVMQLVRPVGLEALRGLGIRPAQGWRYLPADSTHELMRLAAS